MAKLQAGYLFPEVCDGMCSYLLCCYAIVVDLYTSFIWPVIDITVNHLFLRTIDLWFPVSKIFLLCSFRSFQIFLVYVALLFLHGWHIWVYLLCTEPFFFFFSIFLGNLLLINKNKNNRGIKLGCRSIVSSLYIYVSAMTSSIVYQKYNQSHLLYLPLFKISI